MTETSEHEPTPEAVTSAKISEECAKILRENGFDPEDPDVADALNMIADSADTEEALAAAFGMFEQYDLPLDGVLFLMAEDRVVEDAEGYREWKHDPEA